MCESEEYEVLKRFQGQLTREYGEHPAFHDDDFTKKLQRIHEMLQTLKRKLAAEKKHLMKERWETQSLYSIPGPLPVVGPSPSFYPLEYAIPRNVCCPSVDWTSYLVTPNYDYEYCVCNPVALPAGSYVAATEIRDPSFAKLYRSHLEDVERMCDAELANMESSMVNLRRLRRDWNCHELNAPTSQKKKKRRPKRRKCHDYSDVNYCCYHHHHHHEY